MLSFYGRLFKLNVVGVSLDVLFLFACELISIRTDNLDSGNRHMIMSLLVDPAFGQLLRQHLLCGS